MNNGFTVGTTLERGYCESCGNQLPVGSRCAIWVHGERRLFCMKCARKVNMSEWQARAARKFGVMATLGLAVYSLAIYLTWREFTG